ncbi:mitogen-activated protein kinase kinase kinase 1-like protein [Sesbania bispinosa]|nr:mitogen-activated protein kinase kinase kinase 1-like protein [Sesbania bispinosa]
MDSKKLRRKPKLERRNALKYFEYDAGSSSSSLDDSSSGSLYTRSMEIYDRTSFRIEGIEGEFDRICRSLGLSGPEDFAIPAAAWEAMKVRSSSDILPRLKRNEMNLPEKEEPEANEESNVAEKDELSEDEVRVRLRDVDDSGPAETSGCCAESGGGGINGVRPPMLKPPPGMRVPIADNTCSTWDLLRDLAPQGEEGIFDEERELTEKEEGEVDRASPKKEEDGADNAARIAEIVAGLSESCSFTTSNEDDSSSTATDPRSNNVSPNGRIKRVITPSSWQKGEFLGGGSFGSVYEGISE